MTKFWHAKHQFWDKVREMRHIILSSFFMFAITGSTISINFLEEYIFFAAVIYKMALLSMGVLKPEIK